MYSENGFLDLLETKLDKDSKLSTVQKQLINSIGLTSEGSISSSANIFIDDIVNSTLKQNKVTDKVQSGNNNTVKAKARSLYQQQIPISISTNNIYKTNLINVPKWKFGNTPKGHECC